MTYSQSLKKSLLPFTTGRLIPTLGISLVFVLLAHKSPGDLAFFSYVLAAASVVAGFFSLVMATTGNRAAPLTDDPLALDDFFAGGLTLAVSLGTASIGVCLLAMHLFGKAGGVADLDADTYWVLSLIYITSTPLLVINTFLQLFLEATGKASSYSRIKTCVTLICGASLLGCYFSVDQSDFKYFAMGYFFVSELMALLALLKLSGQRRFFSLLEARSLIPWFARTGLPVAAGMSGQKVYFYLLTERLARIDIRLVAELSVFMTVIGFVMIPAVAMAQIHSLEVSKKPTQSHAFFLAGMKWIIGLTALIGAALYVTGPDLFALVGGAVMDYSPRIYLTALLFLACSALMGVAVAHLRARGETLFAQILVNVLMLAGLIPLLYNMSFDRPDISDFLILQSVATLLGFLLLSIRITMIHRRDALSF